MGKNNNSGTQGGSGSPTPVTPGAQVIPFAPGIQVNVGDIIVTNARQGWHVCTRGHVTGPAAPQPGHSSDSFHWSLGPS